MIEFTTTEFVLLIISALGVSGTLHFRARAQHMRELLFGASMFVKKLVNDDRMRDEIREMLNSDKDVDIKFGMEK
jgi:hypothetical protein